MICMQVWVFELGLIVTGVAIGLWLNEWWQQWKRAHAQGTRGGGDAYAVVIRPLAARDPEDEGRAGDE